ncbi:hypothetical protein J2S78_000198 [Salibacterium salarium]|nr:hypothetical protein [Salibacterium salarium]
MNNNDDGMGVISKWRWLLFLPSVRPNMGWREALLLPLDLSDSPNQYGTFSVRFMDLSPNRVA